MKWRRLLKAAGPQVGQSWGLISPDAYKAASMLFGCPQASMAGQTRPSLYGIVYHTPAGFASAGQKKTHKKNNDVLGCFVL